MVEDIKLIKKWDVAHFQDIVLMTFWSFMTRRINELMGTPVGADEEPAEETPSQLVADEETAEESPSPVVEDEEPAKAPPSRIVADEDLPPKLVAAAEDLLAAIETMKEAFRPMDFKSMSKDIRQKDEERDALLRQAKALVKAMARMESMPERQAAGQALLESYQRWRIDPKRAYESESLHVGKWLETIWNAPELTAAAELLGLTPMLQRLGEINTEVSTLIMDRTSETAQYRARQQRQKRKAAEARWRTFVLVLNAAAVMDPDEHRYEAFVNIVNVELKDMHQQMRHTRKRNPRQREAAPSSEPQQL